MQIKKQKASDEAKDELLNFLLENYKDFFNILYRNFSLPSQPMKIIIFEIILGLLSREIKSYLKFSKEYPEINFDYLSSKLASKMVVLLKETTGANKSKDKNKDSEIFILYRSQFLSKIRDQFFSYFDLRFYLLANLSAIIKELENKEIEKENAEKITSNIYMLIKEFPLQTDQSNNKSFFRLHFHPSDESFPINNDNNSNNNNNDNLFPSKKRKRNNPYDNNSVNESKNNSFALSHKLEQKEIKKKYNAVWFAILHMKMTAKTYKEILSEFPSVLPRLTHPEATLDFLISTYEMGSVFAVLSLDSIFLLMTTYNLDYPQFYEKLYNLINVEIFQSAKESTIFLQSLKKYLSSKYLPDYLCAAFCKKLVRTILLAPPPSSLPILPLVYNIIASHPQITTLINRVANWKQGSVLLVSDFSESADLLVDPFDPSQTVPALSNVTDSSLWELTALKNHYYHSINRFTKVFEKPIPPRKKPYDLSDFISPSNGYFVDFATQTRKSKVTSAPMAVKPSTRLVGEKELPAWQF